MRTITLELLRHGPAHNQLLSPLTPYLALCDNHGAVTLNLPFEHNQFLHRLDALGYKLGDKSRLFQLGDTAAVLGGILGAIPGLTAAAGKPSDRGEPITHLRLIISASELALLPFELALAPAGFPGAGQHLLLQSEMPLCLTREIRRAAEGALSWPEKPRILFAAAAPPGVGEIPLQSHLLALRQVIRPWMKYFAPDSAKRNERIEEHLVLLPEASIEDIEEHCATGTFTHVHILAHGVRQEEGYDTRFFLALHNSRDRDHTDYVSGSRLATALCGTTADGKLTKPTFVSLASCDSANVGSVAGAGASIAHALHESGIAMVVAGQFPLSFSGSVVLLETLYNGLLWGEDPRLLVCEVRRKLFTQLKTTHDWASMTVYASLPPNFEQCLSHVQINRAMYSINAALSHADEVTGQLSDMISSGASASLKQTSPIRSRAASRILDAKKKLNSLLKRIPDKEGQIRGLLAGTEKREAEVLFAEMGRLKAKRKAAEITKLEKNGRDQSNQLLAQARDNYWRSFISDRSNYWAVVQYLALDAIVRRIPDLSVQDAAMPHSHAEREEKQPKGLWSMAELLSLYDLSNGSGPDRIWAHGNLIELYLLSLLQEFESVRRDDAEHRALEQTNQLIDNAGADSYAVYSTRRQMRRYLEWFDPLVGTDFGHVRALASKIFERFPASVEEKY